LKKKKSQKKTKIIKFEKNQVREKNQKKSPGGGDTEKIKKKKLQKSFSTRQAISDSCIKVRFE